VQTKSTILVLSLTALLGTAAAQDFLDPCFGLPTHGELKAQLTRIARSFQGNGGLGFPMWATVVNRDGVVCAVTFSGSGRGDQWPGSRLISAQKANTANAFSLPLFALSTANLYAATLPNGTLFGLQESNPINQAVAYGGKPEDFGRVDDPLAGKRIGGINVFGGGLALYSPGGQLIGGLGVSGDTSCADHIIAWKLRYAINLDNVPAGPNGTARDNIIHDIPTGVQVPGQSASGFGHPKCSEAATDIARDLAINYPPGPYPPQ